MLNLNDRVIESKTGTKGIIVDLDFDIEKPYGVLFDDDLEGVWWCSSDEIKKV